MSEIDTFIETCSSGVHPDTVAAVVEIVTNREPFVFTVLPAKGKRIQGSARDRDTVIRKGSEHIEAGGMVSVGLMQVSSKYWKKHDVTIMDMMDPCTNIRVGTSLLKSAFVNAKLAQKDNGEAIAYAIEIYINGNLYENGRKKALATLGQEINLEDAIGSAWASDFGRKRVDDEPEQVN